MSETGETTLFTKSDVPAKFEGVAADQSRELGLSAERTLTFSHPEHGSVLVDLATSRVFSLSSTNVLRKVTSFAGALPFALPEIQNIRIVEAAETLSFPTHTATPVSLDTSTRGKLIAAAALIIAGGGAFMLSQIDNRPPEKRLAGGEVAKTSAGLENPPGESLKNAPPAQDLTVSPEAPSLMENKESGATTSQTDPAPAPEAPKPVLVNPAPIVTVPAEPTDQVDSGPLIMPPVSVATAPTKEEQSTNKPPEPLRMDDPASGPTPPTAQPDSEKTGPQSDLRNDPWSEELAAPKNMRTEPAPSQGPAPEAASADAPAAPSSSASAPSRPHAASKALSLGVELPGEMSDLFTTETKPHEPVAASAVVTDKKEDASESTRDSSADTEENPSASKENEAALPTLTTPSSLAVRLPDWATDLFPHSAPTNIFWAPVSEGASAEAQANFVALPRMQTTGLFALPQFSAERFPFALFESWAPPPTKASSLAIEMPSWASDLFAPDTQEKVAEGEDSSSKAAPVGPLGMR